LFVKLYFVLVANLHYRSRITAFQRHLDPFFEDGESFYDISGSWERFDITLTKTGFTHLVYNSFSVRGNLLRGFDSDYLFKMTSQQHDVDAMYMKNIGVKPRRSRFERVALRDSRRRTAAQLEQRKFKKSNDFRNEDETVENSWCSGVSMRSCRRKSTPLATAAMTAIVENKCSLIISFSESPYRMTTETKRMTGSLRVAEDAHNNGDPLEHPNVTVCWLDILFNFTKFQ
uniref:LAM_G_DOMAIN domain-containing protein n=1 Tax=Angiostrongylus cantonensis TaxID=6313 RepID=A0A0K0D643_ANGCA